MQKPKLVRITTIPLSLEKLLEGQLSFMEQYYDVTAVSAEKERLEAHGEKEGVKTFYVPLTRKITPVQDLKAVYKLYRFLQQEKPSIVHSHTPKAGIVGMLAAYLAKVPHRLHTVAGLPLMEATGFKRRILNIVEKSTYRFATAIYPNSQGLYDFILSENFTSKNKLKIIGKGSSNGIDTNYFSTDHFPEVEQKQMKEELGIDRDDFVFVFVGRIVRDKGINELVSAFVKLQKEHVKCSLLLIGPFEEDLDPLDPQIVEEIHQHPRIYTTGYQQDVRPYFALSDALAFPSYREGFPNVVLQAGAMGLPSIVSDINGCNEIIEADVNGIIVPVKDEQSLYNAMHRLISEPLLAHKLSEKSRSLITSKFERKQVWNALLENYRQL